MSTAWLGDLKRAARRNRRALVKMRGEMWAIARFVGPERASDPHALAQAIASSLPYHFDGEAHRIVDADACAARGYAACGDGAAIALAFFSLTDRRVSLCYETVPGLPDYAHTRVIVDGVPVEPWPWNRDPRATGCTLTVDASRLLGGL